MKASDLLQHFDFDDLANEMLLRLGTPDTGKDRILKFMRSAVFSAMNGAFDDIPDDGRDVIYHVDAFVQRNVW